MELAELKIAIAEGTIKGRKLYNNCRFEKAKKVWAKVYKLKAELKELIFESQLDKR